MIRGGKPAPGARQVGPVDKSSILLAGRAGGITSRSFTAAGLVCFGAIAARCARDEPADPAAAWCEAGSSGAEVVLTPADDEGVWVREGRGSPSFAELWRAAGLNEGEELAFPLNASVSMDGHVAVADFMLAHLILIEPDGGWLPWMRRGKGPGELPHPVAVRWIGRSDTLVVYDIGNSRTVFAAGSELPGRIVNVARRSMGAARPSLRASLR